MSYGIRQAGLRRMVFPRPAIKRFHHHVVDPHRTDIDYIAPAVDTETLHTHNSASFHDTAQGVFR